MRIVSPVSLLVVLLLTVLPVLPARAHGADPRVRVVLDGVEPRADGLTVQVVHSIVPQLVVATQGSTVVEVVDADGEVFLRIGPDGVAADLSSPEWYRANDPTGLGIDVPDGAPPGLTLVSPEPSWGWFDHRLHPGDLSVPPDLAEHPDGLLLASWTIPVRIDGVAGRLWGRVVAAPLLGHVAHRIVEHPDLPDGVDLQLLPGVVPGFVLSAGVDTAAELVVLGRFGEPMLRLDPAGVAVNERSPTWHEHTALTASVRRPDAVADPAAEPLWAVGGSPVATWLDVRGRYDPGVPEGAEDGRPRTLARWDLPLVVDGVAVAAVVETHWVPVDGAGGGAHGSLPLAGAGLVGALGTVVGVRRRRAPRGARS